MAYAHVINERAVAASLGARLRKEKTQAPALIRHGALEVLRPIFFDAKAAIQARFEKKGDAAQAVRETAHLIDQLFKILFQLAGKYVFAQEAGKPKSQLAVIATGGYGRGELFPYSDIDILFLYAGAGKRGGAKISEFILYILWDMGLTVGHAVRSVPETLQAARDDITAATALLDSRLICGAKNVYNELSDRLRKEVMEGESAALEFVEKKLLERDRRHARCGDSRYVLEPNVKEGKGGLRDLHTLWWLAKYNYPVHTLEDLKKVHMLTAEEYREFIAAQQFLWTVRVHMHYLAGRAEERLTFDMQRLIAEKLGYREGTLNQSVERFMKSYFRTARSIGNLTRTVCAALEEEKRRKPRLSLAALLGPEQVGAFINEGGRLNVEDDGLFKKDPTQLIELFALAQEKNLDIHPRVLQLVGRNLALINREFLKNPKANTLFMQILMSEHGPETALRRLSEAGVLERFIPDFGRLIGQMQYDMYHTYTVDEHTLVALGVLHNIRKGLYKAQSPLASEIIHTIESRRVLYLAMLCHDIAKGRGGDHTVLGEKIVLKLAERFGFTAYEAQTAAWLVRHHLLLTHTAFKRDINDPATIAALVEKVQSHERLRLLLLLTVADIRAVGPAVWNGWKGALLRDLYHAAEEKMGKVEESGKTQALRQLKTRLAKELLLWDEAEIDDYLTRGAPAYVLGLDAAQHARVARLLRQAQGEASPVLLNTQADDFRAITEIIVCTPDQQGLFSKIAGAMTLAGANIVGCKIFTLKDGMAVDIFEVQDGEGKAFDKPEKLAKLSTALEAALSGRMQLEKEIAGRKARYPSRMDAIRVSPSVFIDNSVSGTYTVIEVGGRDRLGFLYHVTAALAALGLSIATAHISTYGAQVIDVFYVKDVFGMKVEHENKLREIREALMEVLEGGADARAARCK